MGRALIIGIGFFVLVVVIILAIMFWPPSKTPEEIAEEAAIVKMMAFDCSDWKADPHRPGVPDQCLGQLWNKVGCTSLGKGLNRKVPQAVRDKSLDTYRWAAATAAGYGWTLRDGSANGCRKGTVGAPDECANLGVDGDTLESADQALKCATQLVHDKYRCPHPSPFGDGSSLTTSYKDINTKAQAFSQTPACLDAWATDLS